MFGRKSAGKKNPASRGNYTNIIVKHKLQKFYRIVLLLLVVVAVVAIAWISHKNKVYTDYVVDERHDRTASSNAHTVVLGKYILTYSNDGANCSDTKGKVIWNETFEMQNPIVAINGSAVAIGDYNGRKIFVMNTKGSLGSISTNLPIRSLSVSEDGIVAAVLDDSEVTWIYLYDANGEVKVTFKTTMSQSGYPIDVELSPNSNLAAVSYLSPKDGGIKSSVAFYNFGEVGQNEIDNYMSGYDYQAVVPYVEFMTSGLAFAVADDRIMFYEGNQKPVSKSETLLEDEVQAVYHNEDYVALIFYDVTGEHKYVMRVFDSNGTLRLSKGFDLEYKSVVIENDVFYVYSDSECMIFNIFGTEKYKGTVDDTISLLIPGDSVNKMTVVSTNSIINLQLE